MILMAAVPRPRDGGLNTGVCDSFMTSRCVWLGGDGWMYVLGGDGVADCDGGECCIAGLGKNIDLAVISS